MNVSELLLEYGRISGDSVESSEEVLCFFALGFCEESFLAFDLGSLRGLCTCSFGGVRVGLIVRGCSNARSAVMGFFFNRWNFR